MIDFFELIKNYFNEIEPHHIGLFISVGFTIIGNIIWILFVIRKWKKIEHNTKNNDLKDVKKRIKWYKLMFLNFLLFCANLVNLWCFFIPKSKVNLNKTIEKIQKKINVLKNNT